MKILLLALLLAFPLTACWEKESGAGSEKIIYDPQNPKLLEIVSNNGQSHIFEIELAVTPQQQQQGLMHRTSMADNAGMLFYFGREVERGFWMKNTLIPLDLIFIKQDGTIHHIHENAVPHDLTSIKSNGSVAAVLEINGGFSNKLGLAAGNKVKHPFFEGNQAQ